MFSSQIQVGEKNNYEYDIHKTLHQNCEIRGLLVRDSTLDWRKYAHIIEIY